MVKLEKTMGQELITANSAISTIEMMAHLRWALAMICVSDAIFFRGSKIPTSSPSNTPLNKQI